MKDSEHKKGNNKRKEERLKAGRWKKNVWKYLISKDERRKHLEEDLIKREQRQLLNISLKGEEQEKVRNKRKKKLMRANEMSSKQWLAKEGLVAKKLTILDVLGSTFIPHKAKYVSILDKHVVSKVFDNVLPFAHVSRNQEVNLVNPNGVNLKEYEKKLSVAVEKYKKRLNTLVWNAIPEAAKKEFDSDTPVSFVENKQKYLRLLEEAEWPVKEIDIILLVKEIARGEKFLNQSQTLRKAATGEEEEEEDDGDEAEKQILSARSLKSDISMESGKYESKVGTKVAEINQDDDRESIISERSEKSQRSERSEKSQRSERSERSNMSAAASQKTPQKSERSDRSPDPSLKDDDNFFEVSYD